MDAPQVLTPEQVRRRRRRSVALAIMLGAIVVMFYVITVIRGPAVLTP